MITTLAKRQRRSVIRRSLILELVAKGKMPGDLTTAAGILHQDLEAHHGSSSGLVANLLGIRVDSDRPLGAQTPSPAPFDRLQRLFLALSPEHRDLLGQLCTLSHRPGARLGQLDIATGYEDHEDRTACLTGHVQSLMQAVVRFYRHDPKVGRFFKSA